LIMALRVIRRRAKMINKARVKVKAMSLRVTKKVKVILKRKRMDPSKTNQTLKMLVNRNRAPTLKKSRHSLRLIMTHPQNRKSQRRTRIMQEVATRNRILKL